MNENVLLVGNSARGHAIAEAITRVKPDIIAHFAAQAFNGISWKMETLTHETNYLGTLNVLRAYRARAPRAKLLLACSSAEYGIVPKNEQPIKEHRLLRPLTPYGVSKVGVEALARSCGPERVIVPSPLVTVTR